MVKSFARKAGLNYAWGLINFIAGVALGAALGGFGSGLYQSTLFQ